MPCYRVLCNGERSTGGRNGVQCGESNVMGGGGTGSLQMGTYTIARTRAQPRTSRFVLAPRVTDLHLITWKYTCSKARFENGLQDSERENDGSSMGAQKSGLVSLF